MIQQHHHLEPKHKALEPQERFCHILQKKVTVLVEYPDYKNPANKGKESALYCGNILPCYHNDVKCMYSGISPSHRDPFLPTNSDLAEELEINPKNAGDPK